MQVKSVGVKNGREKSLSVERGTRLVVMQRDDEVNRWENKKGVNSDIYYHTVKVARGTSFAMWIVQEKCGQPSLDLSSPNTRGS